MSSKKKLGDCKKVFRFSPGLSAKIVNRDKKDFDPGCGTWESKSKMPSAEENLLKNNRIEPDGEYRVVKGYDIDGVVKYILQEKAKWKSSECGKVFHKFDTKLEADGRKAELLQEQADKLRLATATKREEERKDKEA